MSERFLRRDFLKLAWITVGSATVTACAPKLAKAIISTPDIYNLSISPTPTVPPTETLIPTVAPEVWKLSLDKRVELLKDSGFLKKIVRSQFDVNQSKEANRKVLLNNLCGEVTLAEICMMCEYFETGIFSDINAGEVCRKLDGKEFIDIRGYPAKYIDSDDQMFFVGLPDALMLLIPELISKPEFLTLDNGARDDARIVPQPWQDILSKAQTVCENGGLIIINFLKYGGGHILFATNVKEDGTAMIVDSYTGKVQDVLLKSYVDLGIDKENPFLKTNEQPALFGMIGVTPKLSTPAKF